MMLDSLAGGLLQGLLELLWCIILLPMALLASTPFVLLFALAAALRRKQRFSHAVADGYSSVVDFWMRWAI